MAKTHVKTEDIDIVIYLQGGVILMALNAMVAAANEGVAQPEEAQGAEAEGAG